jgi:hypothetical protein
LSVEFSQLPQESQLGGFIRGILDFVQDRLFATQPVAFAKPRQDFLKHAGPIRVIETSILEVAHAVPQPFIIEPIPQMVQVSWLPFGMEAVERLDHFAQTRMLHRVGRDFLSG